MPFWTMFFKIDRTMIEEIQQIKKEER